MTEIKYVDGDATQPIGNGNKIIVHVCNDIGAWGKGFVMAISKRWKTPEENYKRWYASKEFFCLGEVQLVQVEKTIWVANLIGQHKIRNNKEANPPIRYDAIKIGLHKVVEEAEDLNASVHMPRIGCGLAGGKWELIEPLIEETLLKNNIETIVYDFK